MSQALAPSWHSPALVAVTFAPISLTSLTGRMSALIAWGEEPCEQLTLGYDRAGRPGVEIATSGRSIGIFGTAPLTMGRWVRLSVVATGTEIRLYVDGTCVGVEPWSTGLPALDDGGLVVGRRSDTAGNEGDPWMESACGPIRDVRVLTSLDATEAVRLAEAAGPPDLDDLDIVAALASLRRSDPNRPEYHFMPPAHWMNEPHGPIQVGEVHHLFYQANRRGAFWGAIEWGHAVSRDLVHWTHLPPALSPATEPVAPNGIWSGSSVIDETGTPLLFFTAGDFGRHPDQAIAVARPVDPSYTSWRSDGTLLVEMPAQVDGHDLLTGQFRDPFVWREHDRWFMLVGAGVAGRGGTAVLYRSDDGADWKSAGLLLTGDQAAYPETGEMWELPVLLPITNAEGNQRHVFLICPWWRQRPPEHIVEVLYWVGHWDPATASFIPDHVEPRRFDYGRHFTGPSGTVLQDGRTILWSVTQDGRPTDVHRQTAWAHNAGLPLELTLTAAGDLAVRPVRELESLRCELLVALTDLSSPADVPPVIGMSVEAELHAHLPPDSEPLRLQLLKPDGELHCEIAVDVAGQSMELTRPGAATYDTWHPGTQDSGDVEVDNGSVRLRIFLDHSMVEVYVNDSRSLTTRIDVTAGDPTLRLTFGPGTRIASYRAWRLAAA